MISPKESAHIFYNQYDRYKENSLTQKWIKHNDIFSLLKHHSHNNRFIITEVGKSIQERGVYLIKAGFGKNKIFMWSQMHGDESTATMAIFDLLKFLSVHDEFDSFRDLIFEKNTIYLLPMLNPDGAELFQRRNAIEIDLNRDALKLQSPESIILKTVFENIKPDYGFNLHDQSSRYSVGNSNRQASISFLAPAGDERKSITSNRKCAMQIIAQLNEVISDFIPGHVAKYSDEFEPRAFGDNFQKWGMSTILIESGGWKDDPEKQFLRRINFVLYLSSFVSIANQSFKSIDTIQYESIPENQKLIIDIILRNLSFSLNDGKVFMDIGINREELTTPDGKRFFKSLIEDVGDLSTFYGIEDYNMSGYEVFPGKVSKTVYNSEDQILKINFNDMYKEGITDIQISTKSELSTFTSIPVNLIRNDRDNLILENKIKPGASADLYLSKDNKINYVLANGFLYNIISQSGKVLNGIVKPF